MFNFEGQKIFFYTVPIDMRNAIDGLSVKVAQEMSCDVQTGVFVFYNKGRNKIKILYWERK